MNAAPTIPCPYCPRQARQVGGQSVYPHRPDLYGKRFFQCAPCDAYVGCHPDGKPLGRLANAHLRRAKMAVHALFDPLWETLEAQRAAYPDEPHLNKKLQRVMRTRAYHWLSAQLGLKFDDTHFGMFDEEQCAKAVEVIRAARIDAAGVRTWAKERRAAA